MGLHPYVYAFTSTHQTIHRLTIAGPKLTHAQWEICESYGGWTRFVDHYGLKRPWERVQWTEGIKILDIISRRIDATYPESPGHVTT
jgi:hypothetical protein